MGKGMERSGDSFFNPQGDRDTRVNRMVGGRSATRSAGAKRAPEYSQTLSPHVFSTYEDFLAEGNIPLSGEIYVCGEFDTYIKVSPALRRAGVNPLLYAEEGEPCEAREALWLPGTRLIYAIDPPRGPEPPAGEWRREKIPAPWTPPPAEFFQ